MISPSVVICSTFFFGVVGGVEVEGGVDVAKKEEMEDEAALGSEASFTSSWGEGELRRLEGRESRGREVSRGCVWKGTKEGETNLGVKTMARLEEVIRLCVDS